MRTGGSRESLISALCFKWSSSSGFSKVLSHFRSKTKEGVELGAQKCVDVK